MLAAKGARVILACRNMTACEVAAKSCGNEGIPKLVDFAKLSSVDALATRVLQEFERLDILVLNAGVVLQPFSLTSDGVESVFAVNHVSQQFLFRQLRPLLVKTAMAFGNVSVVSVSSASHFDSYSEGML